MKKFLLLIFVMVFLFCNQSEDRERSKKDIKIYKPLKLADVFCLLNDTCDGGTNIEFLKQRQGVYHSFSEIFLNTSASSTNDVKNWRVENINQGTFIKTDIPYKKLVLSVICSTDSLFILKFSEETAVVVDVSANQAIAFMKKPGYPDFNFGTLGAVLLLDNATLMPVLSLKKNYLKQSLVVEKYLYQKEPARLLFSSFRMDDMPFDSFANLNSLIEFLGRSRNMVKDNFQNLDSVAAKYFVRAPFWIEYPMQLPFHASE